LGTAVFGGMFVATFLSLFVVPVLYIVIVSLREQLMPSKTDEETLQSVETNGKVPVVRE
jgi:HAE1 family hydrophobic/amphiphilic exporter-1